MPAAFAFKVWIVAILCLLAPPGRARSWDKSEETTGEGYARYWSMAADYEEVLSSLPAGDLVDGSKKKSAAYLLAIGLYESGYSKNTDLGLGPRARGDGGRSVCHLQVNLGRGKTPQGWTAADLLSDRRKCIRRGLEIVKLSLGACRSYGPGLDLALYAAGSCLRGHRESRDRVRLAERLARRRMPLAEPLAEPLVRPLARPLAPEAVPE